MSYIRIHMAIITNTFSNITKMDIAPGQRDSFKPSRLRINSNYDLSLTTLTLIRLTVICTTCPVLGRPSLTTPPLTR
jgi:hypothetical protein